MVASADSLELGPDNLAFVFDSNVGVSAADLGLFLQRASTVSRRAGADLYVVALREGSLAVITRVARKGARAAIKEFKSSPIRTSASGVALVGAVTVALGVAMDPKSGQPSPLAKAAAALVEDHSVTQISLVTVNRTVVVMDEDRAAEVRQLQVERPYEALPSPEVRKLIASAKTGELAGVVLLVDGEMHFRPDGFRYLVPIGPLPESVAAVVRPDRHITVWGELLLRDSQPDLLIVRDAWPQ